MMVAVAGVTLRLKDPYQRTDLTETFVIDGHIVLEILLAFATTYLTKTENGYVNVLSHRLYSIIV